jgi:hypothetical protein
MFKKLKLLHGGISTVADLEASLAEFDIAALESAYVTAQQRRTDLLLTGSDVEILAAEDAATKARLSLDRAVAAVAELTRRLDEARQAEARATAQKRRDDAEAAVAKAVARIRSDYVVHAGAIAKLVEEANAADAAAELFNNEVYATGEYEDIAPVKLVHEGLGWSKKFDLPPRFGSSISLPEVGDFHSIGAHARWLTKLEKFVVLGVGNPDDFLEKAS